MRSRIPKHQIELLGAVPLFSGCSQAELRAIAQLGTPITAEPGAVLTQKGKPGSEFFLVTEGTASCKIGRREVVQFTTGGSMLMTTPSIGVKMLARLSQRLAEEDTQYAI